MSTQVEKCETCDGSGSVMRYPYYAFIMPEKQRHTCSDCYGHGEILAVDSALPIKRVDARGDR